MSLDKIVYSVILYELMMMIRPTSVSMCYSGYSYALLACASSCARMAGR